MWKKEKGKERGEMRRDGDGRGSGSSRVEEVEE